MSTEIELKLSLPLNGVARLQRSPLLKSLSISSPVNHKLYSIYYDTPDLDLRSRRVALRLRREGRRWTQAVKGGGSVAAGLHQRQEFEVPVLRGQPDLTKISNSSLATLFDVRALREQLRPVFTTEFTRSIRTLRLAGGSEVEFCLDRGKITANGASAPICEIELELKSGNRLSLFQLALDLLHSVPDSVPLRLENVSKAERGYALFSGRGSPPGKAMTVELAAEMNTSEAFYTIAWNCLDHLHNNEAGMRERADPEYLHQMRVALRRERSALSVFSRAFSKSAFAEMVQELRWIAGKLGPARDWDVFVTKTIVPVCAAFPQHPGLQVLQEKCEKIREQHNDDACNAVESRHYTELMLKLGAWLSAEPRLDANYHESSNLPESGCGAPVVKFAEPLLARRHRQLKKYGRKLESLDTHQLHALRIVVKKQRYATEFFAGLYPQKETRHYIQPLSGLQEILGIINDVAIVERLLGELSLKGNQDEENQGNEREAAGIIRGWSASMASLKKRELSKAWANFDKNKPFW
jgi:inorganic triphosphatase YgiF